MILDKIENYQRYINLHPAFEDAFKFLLNADKTMSGRFELNGDSFINIETVDGRGQAAAKLEIHKKYIDIQYVLDGEDCIGWAPAEPAAADAAYSSENDFGLLKYPAESWFKLPQGYFAVFFPEDGHAPLASDCRMVKAVAKVRR